jgi:hypothetical protein
MKNFLQTSALALITVMLFTAALLFAESLIRDVPDIMFSYTTGECSHMVTYTKTGPVETPCPETLPRKYNKVWIH